MNLKNSDNPKKLVSAEERDKISRNLLIWLNTFPDIPDDVLVGNPLTPINFEFLEDNKPGIALSTIQAPYILAPDILGGYTAEYQFNLIYRIIPGNTTGPDKRLKADELLNQMGDWATRSVPDLGVGIHAVKVEPVTDASMLPPYENGDEDHQIIMRMIYEVI